MIEIAIVLMVVAALAAIIVLAIWYGGKSEEVKQYENENEIMRRARIVRERAKRLYRG